MPDRGGSALRIEALREARRGTRLGHTVHYLLRTGSTNDVARELGLEGAPEGTVVIAETQSRGRGRFQRTWVSPPLRNLYLSVLLRPPLPPDSIPQIALLAGVATAEAVRAFDADAAIKWPNDVVVDGRKVAGILAEMEADEGRVDFVVAGIGVNLNGSAEDFPAELRRRAIHLQEAAGAPVDRTVFAERLLSRLEERYDLFLAEGFAALKPAWQSLSCLTGRSVRIDDQKQSHTGTVAGIDDDGTLLLRTADGATLHIVAGDVTVVNGYDSGPETATETGKPNRDD
jgi:BirA family biotin operon repressor/biotin-[acetyl-CoA-carboxylase] ligase